MYVTCTVATPVKTPGRKLKKEQNKADESGIRTHAPEETRSLVWRLRPLGHLAFQMMLQVIFSLNAALPVFGQR